MLYHNVLGILSYNKNMTHMTHGVTSHDIHTLHSTPLNAKRWYHDNGLSTLMKPLNIHSTHCQQVHSNKDGLTLCHHQQYVSNTLDKQIRNISYFPQ